MQISTCPCGWSERLLQELIKQKLVLKILIFSPISMPKLMLIFQRSLWKCDIIWWPHLVVLSMFSSRVQGNRRPAGGRTWFKLGLDSIPARGLSSNPSTIAVYNLDISNDFVVRFSLSFIAESSFFCTVFIWLANYSNAAFKYSYLIRVLQPFHYPRTYQYTHSPKV